MASSKLNLKHPQFEVTKQVPVGFSWTILFFGCFPPIFRGDWKWGLIIFLLAVVSFGLANLVFMFIYNKLYIQSLLDQGYTSIDSEEILKLAEAKLGRRIPRNKDE